MVNGKAKLLRDDYCDGLGNCLPACPTGAITFEEREALDYNEEEVKINIQKQEKTNKTDERISGGCPGSRVMNIQREEINNVPADEKPGNTAQSQLRQWPVQIQLVPIKAPYFKGAELLIAADCTAYAFGDFHQFMKNKITIIGCPKLDDANYSDKLTEIFAQNELRSVTVIRMEVPCCGGIVYAAKEAILKSGKLLPFRVVTISTDGKILEDL